MNGQARFSFGTVVFTALTTFVVSAAGGVLVSQWADRAIPIATIETVGFIGSEGDILIDESLQELTRRNSWLDSLKRFETWTHLSEELEKAQRVSKRLELSIAISEDWLDKNSNAMEKHDTAWSFERLNGYPYMLEDAIGSSLVGMSRRSEIDDYPVRLQDIPTDNAVTELSFLGSAWNIHMHDREVLVLTDDVRTTVGKNALEVLAKSMVYGIKENLVYFIEIFLRDGRDELLQLKKIQEKLHRVLYPQIHLYANTTIFNAGNSPILVKPHALFRILNESIQENEFIMTGTSGDKDVGKDAAILDLLGMEENQGRKVVIESFLPNADAIRYVMIPPSSQARIRLESAKPLGSYAKEFRTIYDTKALKCRVVFSTIDGKVVESNIALFGQSISEDAIKELGGKRQ